MSVSFEPSSAPAAHQDDDELLISMANGNAAEVLVLLGLDPAEPYGEDDAANFLGRVLLARALLTSDAARPCAQDGNWIEAPRRAGYLGSRLGELQDLAEHCAVRGQTVRWG